MVTSRSVTVAPSAMDTLTFAERVPVTIVPSAIVVFAFTYPSTPSRTPITSIPLIITFAPAGTVTVCVVSPYITSPSRAV